MQERYRIGADRAFQSVFDFPGEKVKRFLPAGVCIQNIKGLAYQITSPSNSFEDYFTQEEQAYCKDRLESYAGRFAGKMAILQIIGGDQLLGFPVYMNDISIEALPSGKPVVKFIGEVEELNKTENITVSISHDADTAVAMALRIPTGDMARIGIDIASYERIYQALRRHGNRFVKKQFTLQEAIEADGDTTKLTQKWAVKEAVAKALGTGLWREGVSWKDIEILTNEDKKSQVLLSGGAAEKAELLNIHDWSLHLEKVYDTELAFVIAH